MKKGVISFVLALFFPLLFFVLQTITQIVPMIYYVAKLGGNELQYNIAMSELTNAWPAVYAIASVLFLIIVSRIFKKNGMPAGLIPRAPGAQMFLTSILLGLLLFLFTVQFLELLPMPGAWVDSYNELIESFESGMDVGSVLIYAVILAPIMEEAVFRGLCLSSLLAGMPVWLAVFLQAVLFAAYHMNMVQFIYALIPGAALGLIFVFTRSMWCSIAAHIMYNSANYFISNWEPQQGASGALAAALLIALAIACLISMYHNRARSTE